MYFDCRSLWQKVQTVRLGVAVAPEMLEHGATMLKTLDEIHALSLEDALKHDMEAVGKTMLKLPEILPKLENALSENAKDLVKSIKDALGKIEEWIAATLVPDFNKEIKHIKDFCDARIVDPKDESIDIMAAKLLGSALQSFVSTFGRTTLVSMFDSA